MKERHEISVLLTDDEEGIRQIMSDLLELEGFKLFMAGGGNEALEVLKANKIDFIITDVRMAKGDGIFLLKQVKENYPGIPHIVLMSGFTEVTTDEVKKLGGIDLMAKPVDINALVEVIKKYCSCN